MLIHKVGSAAALMVAALYSSEARAEAGAPACVWASFVEVFAGAPDCPGVGYAVIDIDYLYYLDAELAYVMLGSEEDDGILVPLDAWTMQEDGPHTLLLGTPNVAEYFGVEPDVVLESFPLRPTSGWMEGCAYTEYGEEASPRINTCDGQAIRWISDDTVELVDPAPRNSKGELGQWAGCRAPNNDAGVVDASVLVLCDQITPGSPPVVGEPDPDPMTDTDPVTDPEPTLDDEPMMYGDPAPADPIIDDLTDEPASDEPTGGETTQSNEETSSVEAGTGNPDPTTEDDDVATPPVSPTGEQGDDEPHDTRRDASTAQNNDHPAARDAGPTQGEPVQHGLESKDASGCDCSVVKTRSRGAIWVTLLAGLFASYGIRRGLGRRAQGR